MDLTGLGTIADFAKGIVDRIWPPDASPEAKMEAELKVQGMIAARDQQLVAAQKDIIVAEVSQGDNYTKRARPTIVYAGLGFIFLVHVLVPIVAFFTGKTMPTLSLPDEFWWAWSSVVGIWTLGRSYEKGGTKNKVSSLITGVK